MKLLSACIAICLALASPSLARAEECTGPDLCLDFTPPVLPILYLGTTTFFVAGDLFISEPSSTYGFFEAALQGTAATYLVIRSAQEAFDGKVGYAAGLGALAVGSGLLTWHGVHVFRRGERKRKGLALAPLPVAGGLGLTVSGAL